MNRFLSGLSLSDGLLATLTNPFLTSGQLVAGTSATEAVTGARMGDDFVATLTLEHGLSLSERWGLPGRTVFESYAGAAAIAAGRSNEAAEVA